MGMRTKQGKTPNSFLWSMIEVKWSRSVMSDSSQPGRLYKEGNGTPLQHSCLENAMDGGAWWAAVHEVTTSRTQLSDFTFTFHFHALEKAMAPHSSTVAWRIPWTEEPGGLQSMGSLRVGHDWVTSFSLFTFMHWRRQWHPTLVFLPGESEGLGSLVGCRLWGHRVGHDWSDLAAAADYTAQGIFQARILEWVASPFSRASSQPRDRTQVSRSYRQFLYQLSHKGSPIKAW